MRFSMKNIRWAKAQGLGRHVTRFAKTSHTLAQYRYDALESAPNFLFYFILFTFDFLSFSQDFSY